MAMEAFQSFSRVTTPLSGPCPTSFATESGVKLPTESYLRAPGLGNGRFNSTFVMGNETQMTAVATAIRAVPRMIFRNGRFYIWGGLTTAATNDFNSYDITTDSYSSVTQTSTPAGRYAHEAAIYNDELYIFAGYSGGVINTMYKYNFTSQAWSLVTPSSGTTPTARYGMCGDVVGNLWYLHGGTDGTTPKNDFYTFNFDTLAWTTLTSSGFPASWSTVRAIGNGIYVAGGENANFTAWYNTTKFYNFATSSWTTTAVLPAVRSRMTSWVCDGGMHAIGGTFQGGGSGTATTHWFYDPVRDLWQNLKPIGTAFAESAVGYCNNAVWSLGGLNAAGARMTNLRKYT